MSDTTTRALSLLNLLQTHRHWPGSELADRLGVTERTVRRDVERLRDLGYRIESSPGSAGGYRLEAGSAVPPLLLTDEEAVAMAIGLRVAASQRLVSGPETTITALAKLEQGLPAPRRRRVNALAATVQPTGINAGAAVSSEVLGELALACRDHERVRFSYTAASGEATRRRVEPHALAPAERHWYLLCWDLDKDDWRTFRVDRLEAVEHTRVLFEPKPLTPEQIEARQRVARQFCEIHLPDDTPQNRDARLAVIPAPQPASGIAGHWAPTLESYPGLAVIARPMQVSEAGRAAAAEARRASAGTGGALPCQPFPPPFISLFPDLRTIEVNDANVVMRFEGAIGVPMERVVHLDQDAHPVGVTPSLMGHSIGRFENGTLIVETAHYAPGVLNQYVEDAGKPTRGLLHSAALRATERIRFDAARGRLVVEIDHVDPDYFTQPFPRVTLEYAPSALKIEPFNCAPAGTTGLIRK